MTIHLRATAWRPKNGKMIPLNAKTMKGIFEIERHDSDRNQDKLRWCFAKPDKPRPTGFDIEKDSGVTKVELQRFVLDEDRIVDELEKAGATIYKDSQGGWVNEIVLPSNFDSSVATKNIRGLRKLSSVISYVADDELIDSLVGNSMLRSLRFRCPVRSDQLDYLAAELPSVQALRFGCEELTEAHCRAIQKFKSLGSLQLGGVSKDLSSLKILKDNQKIRSLKLNGCEIDRASLQQIADNLKSLYWFEINDCQIHKGTLEPIAKINRLSSLTLKGNTIGDDQICSLKFNPRLKTLEISGTAVTNVSLAHIIHQFPRVYSVRAEKVGFDPGIIEIVKSIPTNRQFRVTVSKSSVTHEQVNQAGGNVAQRISVVGW